MEIGPNRRSFIDLTHLCRKKPFFWLENGYSFDNYYTPVFQQGATCNSEYMSLTGLQAITTNDWSNNVCELNTSKSLVGNIYN